MDKLDNQIKNLILYVRNIKMHWVLLLVLVSILLSLIGWFNFIFLHYPSEGLRFEGIYLYIFVHVHVWVVCWLTWLFARTWVYIGRFIAIQEYIIMRDHLRIWIKDVKDESNGLTVSQRKLREGFIVEQKIEMKRWSEYLDEKRNKMNQTIEKVAVSIVCLVGCEFLVIIRFILMELPSIF